MDFQVGRSNGKTKVVDYSDLPDDDSYVRSEQGLFADQQHLAKEKSIQNSRVITPRHADDIEQLEMEFANMTPKSPLGHVEHSNLGVHTGKSGSLSQLGIQCRPPLTTGSHDPRCDPRAIPHVAKSSTACQPTDAKMDSHPQAMGGHPRQPSGVEVVAAQTPRPKIDVSQLQKLAQCHNEPWKADLVKKIMRQYQKTKRCVPVSPEPDLESDIGNKKGKQLHMKVVPEDPIGDDEPITITDSDYEDIRDTKPSLVTQPEMTLLSCQPSTSDDNRSSDFAIAQYGCYSFRKDQFLKGSVVPGTQTSLVHLLREYFTRPTELAVGAHGILTTKNNKPTDFGEYEETDLGIGYQYIRDAGKGSYGFVKLYKDNTTNIQFVKKEILRVDNTFQLEARLHSELHHINITELYGFIVRDGKPEILMEYAGVSLIEYTMKPESEDDLKEEKIIDILYQGLSALEYLNSKSIIHYDVKPENICILKTGDRISLKLTDFGSAKEENQPPDFRGCTVEYLSPELGIQLITSKYQHGVQALFGFDTSNFILTTKSDIFSLALTIMFIYRRGHVVISLFNNGSMTYNGLDEASVNKIRQTILIYLAKNPASVKNLLIPDKCSSAMKSILRDMVEEFPHKRPSPTHLKETMDDLLDRKKRPTDVPVFLTFGTYSADRRVNLNRQLSSRSNVGQNAGSFGPMRQNSRRDHGVLPYGYTATAQKIDTSDDDVCKELKEMVPKFSFFDSNAKK